MKNKWNWIDTTIVIIIILGIIVFMNRDRLSETIDEDGSTRENVRIFFEAKGLDEDILENLNIGDQYYYQNSLEEAFIEDYTVSPQMKNAVGSDGSVVEVELAERVNLQLVLSAEVEKTGPYMHLGAQELKVGLDFIMKTEDVELRGRIKHIEVN